jgi:hypothetical protein
LQQGHVASAVSLSLDETDFGARGARVDLGLGVIGHGRLGASALLGRRRRSPSFVT